MVSRLSLRARKLSFEASAMLHPFFLLSASSYDSMLPWCQGVYKRDCVQVDPLFWMCAGCLNECVSIDDPPYFKLGLLLISRAFGMELQ